MWEAKMKWKESRKEEKRERNESKPKNLPSCIDASVYNRFEANVQVDQQEYEEESLNRNMTHKWSDDRFRSYRIKSPIITSAVGTSALRAGNKLMRNMRRRKKRWKCYILCVFFSLLLLRVLFQFIARMTMSKMVKWWNATIITHRLDNSGCKKWNRILTVAHIPNWNPVSGIELWRLFSFFSGDIGTLLIRRGGDCTYSIATAIVSLLSDIHWHVTVSKFEILTIAKKIGQQKSPNQTYYCEYAADAQLSI